MLSLFGRFTHLYLDWEKMVWVSGNRLPFGARRIGQECASMGLVSEGVGGCTETLRTKCTFEELVI